MRKKHILPLIVISFILTCVSINAQDFSVNAGGDFVSLYVWRGLNINDQPNIQPYINFEYSGLHAGFWGSYGIAHLNSTDDNYSFKSEIDTYLEYNLEINNSLNISALVTDYYFPNGGIKIGNYNNYDNQNGAGAHTIEAGLIFSGAECFPLSLSGYINVYNDKGNNTYFEIAYSTILNDFGIDISAGAAGGSKDNPEYYGTDKFNLIQLGLKISKSIKISDTFSFPVFCSYTLNPNSENAYLVLGISL